MKALDNDNNSTIMKLNSEKIQEHKVNILTDIGFPDDIKTELLETLKEYRVCTTCAIGSKGDIYGGYQSKT